jgi:hypothetical protein
MADHKLWSEMADHHQLWYHAEKKGVCNLQRREDEETPEGTGRKDKESGNSRLMRIINSEV